ncbi:hypothetical protein F5Y17DRAFT_463892 [Xylariaceae sp. FL0594]|nr:hypothetical protein F5Y17DRAFT_463892 [Xylariaceae sp. FL0594]
MSHKPTQRHTVSGHSAPAPTHTSITGGSPFPFTIPDTPVTQPKESSSSSDEDSDSDSETSSPIRATPNLFAPLSPEPPIGPTLSGDNTEIPPRSLQQELDEAESPSISSSPTFHTVRRHSRTSTPDIQLPPIEDVLRIIDNLTASAMATPTRPTASSSQARQTPVARTVPVQSSPAPPAQPETEDREDTPTRYIPPAAEIHNADNIEITLFDPAPFDTIMDLDDSTIQLTNDRIVNPPE